MYIPQGYAFLYGSVFTVMKKNETKGVRTKASEVRSQKEQMEDRAFNRMLLWLAGTVLTEVVLLLVNRYYIHARVEELEHLATIHTILGIAPIAGVVLFAGFLYWGLQQRKKGDEHRDGIIQIILACAFLVMGVGAFGMRLYGAAAAPLILGIVPGLGVLMLVFYLYQKEFFACAFAGGLGILGLWVFRTFHLYGGTGGRMDHTLANLQGLGFLAQHGARGYLYDETFVFTAIRNGSITLPKREEGIFSVFCLGPKAHGITIRGAKYCLEGADLDAFFPLGVSNHFQGEEVAISVEDGCLLIGWEI